MKQAKGWAGGWREVPKGDITIFRGPDAEARCAKAYFDPRPVIVSLDRKKDAKVKGKPR